MPVYVLHLPLIGAIGFYVIQLELPMVIDYMAILVLSLISSVLLYEIAVRRFHFVRFFFGLK